MPEKLNTLVPAIIMRYTMNCMLPVRMVHFLVKVDLVKEPTNPFASETISTMVKVIYTTDMTIQHR